ncbi:interferon-induced protein 44-like [Pelmatolapia mariae]|uniref:interferon-induced protein 44-like n=1 Tax=Pelmatolapia mariae TaxID=158779 RepID=UPI003211DBF5
MAGSEGRPSAGVIPHSDAAVLGANRADGNGGGDTSLEAGRAEGSGGVWEVVHSGDDSQQAAWQTTDDVEAAVWDPKAAWPSQHQARQRLKLTLYQATPDQAKQKLKATPDQAKQKLKATPDQAKQKLKATPDQATLMAGRAPRQFNSLGSRVEGTGRAQDPDDVEAWGGRQYTTYRIKKGNIFYPFVLNDMMGLKDTTSRGNRRIHVKDVKQALKGHIKDGYTFNPENKLSKGDRYYNRTPTENDKVHILVCVVDANTVSLMNDATVEAIQDVRDEAADLEIPQVAIFTKIDEAFPEINHDVKNVYKSKSLQERIQQFSKRVGIPINCIFPVKNYHSETEVNPDIDAIIMNAMRRIIEIGNDSLNRKLRSQT